MKFRLLLCLLIADCICFAEPPVGQIRKHSRQYHDIREDILRTPATRITSISPYNKILPGLYLGDRGTAEKISRLSDVTHVLSILEPVKKIKGVVWKGIEIEDKPSQPVLKHFDEAFLFIEGSKGAVYIHCKSGISRSATFVIGYLIWKFDVPYKDAHRFVQSKRPQIAPNPGFDAQLRYYEVSRKK